MYRLEAGSEEIPLTNLWSAAQCHSILLLHQNSGLGNSASLHHSICPCSSIGACLFICSFIVSLGHVSHSLRHTDSEKEIGEKIINFVVRREYGDICEARKFSWMFHCFLTLTRRKHAALGSALIELLDPGLEHHFQPSGWAFYSSAYLSQDEDIKWPAPYPKESMCFFFKAWSGKVEIHIPHIQRKMKCWTVSVSENISEKWWFKGNTHCKNN